MTRISFALARAIAGALFAIAASSCQAGAQGSPFVVNNYRAGAQYLFGAASGGNGDALLLWQDNARGNYFFIQRFDGDGNRLQSDDWYVGPNVVQAAVDRVGNFVVATVEPDGTGQSLYLTMYRRDGSLGVPKFKVNSTPETSISGVVLAANGNGQLAVLWTVGRSNWTWAPVARSFSWNGTPLSPQVQVGAASPVVVTQGVAMDASGSFGAVWSAGTTSSATGTDVYFRRFSSAGFALTSETRVNTYVAGTQANASIAMASSGATIVTWESGGQDGDRFGVYGQRFDSSGWKVGGEFRVNETTSGDQTGSQVGMTDEGHFMVSWYSDNRARISNSVPVVYIRQYRADGTPVGGETPVYAPASPELPTFPYLALNAAGQATIAWRNALSSTDVDVYAQRYLMDTQPPVTALSNGIATTGLSGAAGSWSYFKVTVPSGKPSLNITLSGPGTGDANLYGRLGGLPTLSSAEVVSTVPGNSESIVINNVPAGTWYIGVYGATAYSGATLTVRY